MQIKIFWIFRFFQEIKFGFFLVQVMGSLGVVTKMINGLSVNKIDVFGNPAWFSLFPNAHQWFLDNFGSDHRPVLVKFTDDNELFREYFRYDKRFADDPFCIDAIYRSCNCAMSQGTHSSIFSLTECRMAISVWKHSADTNSHSRIKRLRKDLDELKSLQFPD